MRWRCGRLGFYALGAGATPPALFDQAMRQVAPVTPSTLERPVCDPPTVLPPREPSSQRHASVVAAQLSSYPGTPPLHHAKWGKCHHATVPALPPSTQISGLVVMMHRLAQREAQRHAAASWPKRDSYRGTLHRGGRDGRPCYIAR